MAHWTLLWELQNLDITFYDLLLTVLLSSIGLPMNTAILFRKYDRQSKNHFSLLKMNIYQYLGTYEPFVRKKLIWSNIEKKLKYSTYFGWFALRTCLLKVISVCLSSCVRCFCGSQGLLQNYSPLPLSSLNQSLSYSCHCTHTWAHVMPVKKSMSLGSNQFQRSWEERKQEIQLKHNKA